VPYPKKCLLRLPSFLCVICQASQKSCRLTDQNHTIIRKIWIFEQYRGNQVPAPPPPRPPPPRNPFRRRYTYRPPRSALHTLLQRRAREAAGDTTIGRTAVRDLLHTVRPDAVDAEWLAEARAPSHGGRWGSGTF